MLQTVLQWKQGCLFSSRLCLRLCHNSSPLKRTSSSKSKPSKNAGKLLWALFEMVSHPPIAGKEWKHACNGSNIESHLRRVGFYVDSSKQCLGDIPQINQMVESPDQLWTIPSCLSTHSTSQNPNIQEIKLCNPGLSNLTSLIRQDRNIYQYRHNLKKLK